MSSNKMLLTYKRRHLSAHSYYGGRCARSSKFLKLDGSTTLEEKIKYVESCQVDSFLPKEDSTRIVHSSTTVTEHDVDDFKEKHGSQLPDLNAAEMPSSVVNLSPHTNFCARLTEEHVATHLFSGNSTGHEVLPKTESVQIPDRSAVKAVSVDAINHEEGNVNAVRLETHQRGSSDAPLITFTRRAKMKKEAANMCMDDESMGAKNMPLKPVKDESGSNKNGNFYTRREKSFPPSENDMVAIVEEENHLQHPRDLPDTNVETLGNDLELHAIPCVDNENMEVQLSEHSELVECDKEEHHVKLKSLCTSTSLPNGNDRDEVNKGKQHFHGNFLEENTVCSSAQVMKGSLMNLEHPVSTEDVQKFIPIATAGDRSEGLQWLKLSRDPIHLLEREGRTCPSTREGGPISNIQDRRFQATDINHAKLDWLNRDIPCEQGHKGHAYNVNQFHGRMFLSNFLDGKREAPQFLPERSTVLANFLGPSSSHVDPASSSITNIGVMPKPPGFSNKESPDYGSRFLFGNMPITSKAQAVDNILSGTRLLSHRQGLSLGFRKHLNNWSDEELDSLWIGVRRHGRNNWNAILKDPRLYFHDGRTGKELAERWDIEQSRLFSCIQIPSLIGKSANIAAENLSSEFALSRVETQLSLGNSYIQKSENHMDRNIYQFQDNRNSCPIVGSTPYLTEDYTKNSFWRKANARNQKQARVSKLPIKTPGREGALPHWLKEATAPHPQRVCEASPSPALDLRLNILKRSTVCSSPNTELVLGNEAPTGRKNRLDLNRNSPEQGQRKELVIIGSDASSEETISDDGRS